MSNHQIVTKYINNSPSTMKLSTKEILDDFKKIKPINIAILDISLTYMLGKYMYNYSICNKWEVSPNLLQDILLSVKTKFPNMTKSIDEKIEIFEDEIKEAKIFFEAPDSYKFEKRLENIFLEIYKDNKDNNVKFEKYDLECCRNLLGFKYEINKLIKDCISTYTSEWGSVDIFIKELEQIIMINFEEIESNNAFQDTLSLIETINEKAEKRINVLIINTVELMKSTKLLTKDLNKLESIYIYGELKKHIIKNFNKEMEKIYYEEILSHSFSSEVSMALLEMYEVDKSMHRLALTFSELESDLKNIAKN